MPFTLATWNINSVRLRADLVAKLLADEAPDVLCLQECKSPVDKMPIETFAALGYRHMVARGQKGYNGVAILSRLPLVDAGRQGAVELAEMPDGAKMGRLVLDRGHQGLLPAGSAYRLHADSLSCVLIQTIEGPVTVQKWADICQS